MLIPFSFLLILFSDMVNDPSGTAEEIYDFLGRSVPATVSSYVNDYGLIKRDILKGREMPDKGWSWNSTYTSLVEEECKPLIMKMGLQFRELDIKYEHSYYWGVLSD